MASTRKKTPWLESIPFHPFFLAAYPVAALLASNIAEVEFVSGLRPVLFSVLLAGLLLLGLRLIYRDWRRAALLTTILLILFYSYGHVYILLKAVNAGGVYLFRHRTLTPLWLLLAGLAVWLAGRKSLNLHSTTYTLNLLGLLLLIFPMVQLSSFSIQARLNRTSAEQDGSALDLNLGSQPPDIYYMILDGYGRADLLASKFGYDNSDFLGTLEDLGFVVADCSLSNYAQTQMSLASSLNFDYIASLSDRFVAGSKDRTGLDALIRESAARRSLERAGYKTVAFATGFLATEWTDADYFLGPGYSWGQLSEFESLLMETSFARLIQDGNRFGMQTAGSERFRERTLFTLDQLDELSYIPGPKFVFAHVIAPHPPYVFGPTGGPVEAGDVGTTRSQEGASQYRDQAIYISSRLREIVPQIIANSDRPPIIVIQGDHGPTIPSSRPGRMSILNAYYLPGAEVQIDPTVTPVNTFRIIFNAYFGQDLELLDDVSLYSDYEDPFDWKVVPNSCRSNE